MVAFLVSLAKCVQGTVDTAELDTAIIYLHPDIQILEWKNPENECCIDVAESVWILHFATFLRMTHFVKKDESS
jgi:hypothetical protein